MLEGVTNLFNSMLNLDGSTSSERIVDMADTLRMLFDP